MSVGAGASEPATAVGGIGGVVVGGASTAWDAGQYLKFADERTRPARELLARVPLDRPRRVVDLGCGPGNSTALLRARWPEAEVSGVDNDPDMLARARRDLPGVDFVAADLQTWSPDGPVDLLYGNAVLQWLPDHASLLPRWLALLPEGGVLAMQMPVNFDEPSHRLMRETRGPWQTSLRAVRAIPRVASASRYYDWLAPHASRVDLWQTTFEHVMPDADAIVEWVKGTGLRPFLDALPDDTTRADFLAAYRTGIDAAYPARADGRRLFSFPRRFFVVVK